MACKVGQFDVVELMVNDQFKTFSINLNAQHVNGMTHFDLALHNVRLWDTLEYTVVQKCSISLFLNALPNFFILFP